MVERVVRNTHDEMGPIHNKGDIAQEDKFGFGV